ncbi:hypothetical protein O988_03136 [Pseudogymnoascus sp. VKM F-3808]|nr:hypothetical protein O988_03136 [Pseudogymnoascus sp. VKM F-3808]
MSRPEDILPPDLHYNDVEARKYTTSSRIQNIQASMTNRALELLDLDSPAMILDIGCGSGLSGEIVSSVEEEYGGQHIWVGMDISASMLDIALQRDVEGDLMLADIGQGVPFRAGTFDAAISISAIQWLCNAESSDVSPTGRLSRFFNGLYASLKRGGRAVCQFYPKNDQQRTMISGAAIKAGFGAGILEDDPGTKNAKLYLVLTVGGAATEGAGGDITGVVKGMEGVDVVDARRAHQAQKKKDAKKGSKAWILNKKEQMERKGKVVKASSNCYPVSTTKSEKKRYTYQSTVHQAKCTSQSFCRSFSLSPQPWLGQPPTAFVRVAALLLPWLVMLLGGPPGALQQELRLQLPSLDATLPLAHVRPPVLRCFLPQRYEPKMALCNGLECDGFGADRPLFASMR